MANAAYVLWPLVVFNTLPLAVFVVSLFHLVGHLVLGDGSC